MTYLVVLEIYFAYKSYEIQNKKYEYDYIIINSILSLKKSI